MSTDHEISHGRNIAWTLRAKQAPEYIRDAWIGTSRILEMSWWKPLWKAISGDPPVPHQPAHYARSPVANLRDRCNIEGWHWIRDTQLNKDAQRYRDNGAGAMATLSTAALSLLRLVRFRSIRTGLQSVMHDITAVLAMAGRQPELHPCWDFESALS
jgi:hypothetical protein